jgi:hypothetical protein
MTGRIFQQEHSEVTFPPVLMEHFWAGAFVSGISFCLAVDVRRKPSD